MWRIGAFSLSHLSGPLRKQVNVCDCYWYISIRFACFYVPCFWTLEFGRVILKNSKFYIYRSKFFHLLLYNVQSMASLDCSCRASKSWRNTDMGKWKLIGTFSLTFTFAASARYCSCRLHLTNTVDATVTVWLTSQKNPKSWNIFDNVGGVLSETAVIVACTLLPVEHICCKFGF